MVVEEHTSGFRTCQPFIPLWWPVTTWSVLRVLIGGIAYCAEGYKCSQTLSLCAEWYKVGSWRLLLQMLPKGFQSWWIQVERTSKIIKYGHQGFRRLLQSALISKIRICCTSKVRLGRLSLVYMCFASLVSRCLLHVFCNFRLCEKGRLGMLTGHTRTVTYWTTNKGNVRLFHSHKLRGKDEASIAKVHQNSCDWNVFIFLVCDS